jgi:hypothetical protein
VIASHVARRRRDHLHDDPGGTRTTPRLTSGHLGRGG